MEEWTGKKKFMKRDDQGVPDPFVFKHFNYLTWKRMVDREREKWVAYDEAELAPIPMEVIDFKEKMSELVEAKKRIAELEGLVKKGHEEEINDDSFPDSPPDDTEPINNDVTEDTGGELTEEEQKDKIKAQLDDLGVKYTHNMKLSTLRKKLDDAVNPE